LSRVPSLGGTPHSQISERFVSDAMLVRPVVPDSQSGKPIDIPHAISHAGIRNGLPDLAHQYPEKAQKPGFLVTIWLSVINM
jgi:hypothetical protein